MVAAALRVIAGTLLATSLASDAFAQARVRVTADRANIWRPNFLTVVTVVEEDTVLEVVSRRGEWLEVVVPRTSGPDRQTGLISIRQVTPVTGALPSDQGPPPPEFRPPTGPQRQPARPLPPPVVDTGVRGFADAGYDWFTARETFNALFTRSSGAFFGGGGEVRARSGAFLQGAARRFRQTGERAFVLDDEVFRLGITDTVTIVPVSVTVGYRFPARTVHPYVGGGGGAYFFKETSEFALASEDIEERFASYHLLGGIEWRSRSFVAAAFEVQYTLVPKSLNSPLAEAFGEDDLGGVAARFKIVVGR
jgi:hypothetical protein